MEDEVIAEEVMEEEDKVVEVDEENRQCRWRWKWKMK